MRINSQKIFLFAFKISVCLKSLKEKHLKNKQSFYHRIWIHFTSFMNSNKIIDAA